MPTTPTKLGIIAGGGTAPAALIKACRQTGREFFVICLDGQADKELAQDVPHIWLPLGAGAHLKEVIADQGIREIVMIGRVRRPSLTELKPDWLALKVLTRIGINSLGDDALLRSIGKAIEQEMGVHMIGAHEVFEDLLTPVGLLTRVTPDDVAQNDIQRGFAVAHALGSCDVGQSVVVQQGIVLGVEAIEGTDALIRRCGELRRDGPGGVLVKTAKPQQDRRYDLPAIGPDTFPSLVQAGLRGVALEAGSSLLIEREKTIALANEAGLFIVGVQTSDD